MRSLHPIHSDFKFYLDLKNQELIALFLDLHHFIFELHLESNSLLYRTYALTSDFILSEKLSNAYCMIPIYTDHLNLGFNRGKLLKNPKKSISQNR